MMFICHFNNMRYCYFCSFPKVSLKSNAGSALFAIYRIVGRPFGLENPENRLSHVRVQVVLPHYNKFPSSFEIDVQ